MELNPLGKPGLHPFPNLETARWLWRLRWVAVVGQLLAITIAIFVVQLPISLWPIVSFVGITAITNMVLGFVLAVERSSSIEDVASPRIASFVTGALILDLLCLSGLLHFSGGFDNPFLFFYFVNIAIAGIILRPFSAWLMTATAIACLVFLLYTSIPVEGISLPHDESDFWSIRTQGFLIAFATSTCVVTYFVTMLTDELNRRERRLTEIEKQRAKGQRLEAMATLAAGAGHELATPLSTIAVVSKELSRNLGKIDAPESIKRDVDLIRSELDRCREILARMKSSAGEAAAEQLDPVSVENLIDAIIEGLRDTRRVVFDCDKTSREATAVLPLQGLALALRNIIQNALDASPDSTLVHIAIESSPQKWTIQVKDHGHGMDEPTLQRIGEPFFTTKEPGRGMGMGVFLSRNVISRLSGTMQYKSVAGQGTTCTIELPLKS